MSDEARKLYETMQTPGWPIAMRILDEMAKTPMDEAIQMVVRKPESLTGRIAIAKINRSSGLTDYKAELNDLVATLNPKGQGSR